MEFSVPFFLFDDARGARGEPARLFTGLVEVIRADSPAELAPALARVRAGLAAGQHAAGWLAYEAGYVLEPRLAPLYRPPPPGEPLLWFGLFRQVERIAPRALEPAFAARLPGPARARIARPAPLVTKAEHAVAHGRIQQLIAAGDIYQANLTFPLALDLAGDPLALYDRLRRAQRAAHGALAATGDHWLLSVSPELLFALAQDGGLTARPMKGTAARAADPAEDAAAADALACDAKNRAENLMIVDLLRNDLSRVAVPGSVAVPSLFHVESLPTVHQMTSTITARLAAGRDALDVLAALFPCGSITGAPKIRAMEVIRSVEPYPRGVYTGAVGWLAPDGAARFNVAIRSLLLTPGRSAARIGVGGGIVADSVAGSEWSEALLKSAFLTRDHPPFDLIETFGWSASAGCIRLERHLARLEASARWFGFAFERAVILAALASALPAPSPPEEEGWRGASSPSPTHRIRLLLSRFGGVSVQTAPLPPAPAGPVGVVLSGLSFNAQDPWLRHKTSNRARYDDERRRLQAGTGCFEALFRNGDGFVTEGSFTHVFALDAGRLLTPPLAHGLLPGILRAELIAKGRAVEAPLTVADLAAVEALYVGNSLRGLLRARLVPPTEPS